MAQALICSGLKTDERGSWPIRLAGISPLLALPLALSLACAGPAEPDPPDVELASCDQPLGGAPLSDTQLESAPGYDEQLAAVDLDAVPGSLDISSLAIDDLALIAYALETPRTELGANLSKESLMGRGEMGRALAASFAPASPGGPAVFDEAFFRRGFHRFYNCDRGQPATLAGFEQLYGEIGSFEETMVVDPSVPKAEPRRLREDLDRHIYIAETLLEDGAVREYEIILGNHRADGALDFLVYDAADGKLTNNGQFKTPRYEKVVSALPLACMNCHVDYSERTFDVIFPDGL